MSTSRKIQKQLELGNELYREGFTRAELAEKKEKEKKKRAAEKAAEKAKIENELVEKKLAIKMNISKELEIFTSQDVNKNSEIILSLLEEENFDSIFSASRNNLKNLSELIITYQKMKAIVRCNQFALDVGNSFNQDEADSSAVKAFHKALFNNLKFPDNSLKDFIKNTESLVVTKEGNLIDARSFSGAARFINGQAATLGQIMQSAKGGCAKSTFDDIKKIRDSDVFNSMINDINVKIAQKNTWLNKINPFAATSSYKIEILENLKEKLVKHSIDKSVSKEDVASIINAWETTSINYISSINKLGNYGAVANAHRNIFRNLLPACFFSKKPSDTKEFIDDLKTKYKATPY